MDAKGTRLKTKPLVVYYSYTGNTKFTAETIAAATGADLLPLRPYQPLRARGFWRYILGGRQVIMGETPELLPFGKDSQDYTMLFIGTPVWAWSYTPPLRTFLKRVNPAGKSVALFCCYSGQTGRTLEQMASALAGADILGRLALMDPLRSERREVTARINVWAMEMAGCAAKKLSSGVTV